MQTLLFSRESFKAEPGNVTLYTLQVGDVFEYTPPSMRYPVPVEVLRITKSEDDGNGIVTTIHGRRWDNQKAVKIRSSRRMGRPWPLAVVPQAELNRRSRERTAELVRCLPKFDSKPRTGDLEGSDESIYSANWESLQAALAEAGESL